ncbi:hypothetical protein PORCRE_827 [Porphyromonas crevioricanis JCM 15906]|uniref:Uncharacterized protein n=1 Tax=Porphyromonas crevioricanis JCM 15906 TaxID=1305617 RepID=T1DS55_9PORP|nr:hypothetical protein PORCRE_827 [Porphyromonas crevioricanis JCM 15906]GAD07082.1 hypothetical protein PORCAN_697 [Porphyromonas crevioricanis JCM 13913]
MVEGATSISFANGEKFCLDPTKNFEFWFCIQYVIFKPISVV